MKNQQFPTSTLNSALMGLDRNPVFLSPIAPLTGIPAAQHLVVSNPIFSVAGVVRPNAALFSIAGLIGTSLNGLPHLLAGHLAISSLTERLAIPSVAARVADFAKEVETHGDI